MLDQYTLSLICLLPFGCGTAVLLWRRAPDLRWLLAACSGAGVLLAAAACAAPLGTAGLGGLLRLDALARVLLAVVTAVGALSTAESVAYWRHELGQAGLGRALPGRGLPRVRTYFFWQQAFLGSLLLAALSGNLGLSWVAIELTTITSAVLVGFSGGAQAVEAAWKYVILCSVGLALALLTVILLYALSGGGGLQSLDWNALQAAARTFPPGPAKLAYLFALVGFGTKAGLAPLHAWLPDAHSEAPAPVSALLSGVLLAVVLTTLVRVAGVTAVATGPALPYDLLLGAGLLSVAVATPFLMLQDDLKRLLAYSSIEQVGLMAIGFGLHAPLATAGAVLQLVVHALVKSGLFFAAGRVVHELGSGQRLPRLRGIGRKAPPLGAALLFGVFTLGGVPPFGMFFSEIAIVQGAIGASVAAGLLLLFLLTTIFAGLTFYVGRSVFGARGQGIQVRPTAWGLTILGVPAALSLVVGLWTPAVVSHAVSAAATLVIGGRGL